MRALEKRLVEDLKKPKPGAGEDDTDGHDDEDCKHILSVQSFLFGNVAGVFGSRVCTRIYSRHVSMQRLHAKNP
jgi:hypothetical protein